MKKVIAYFTDLLATLKRIEKHLETLSSTVTNTHGRDGRYPAIRQCDNQFRN